MAYNSDTSQFIKTYGKPRRMQSLGQTSLWLDDLTDDFDKCLGIENVQQTTFVSPEPIASVTMDKPTKHKKEENKTNNMGWSMQLHSTLSGHKNKSVLKKRNIEDYLDNNFNKIKFLSNCSTRVNKGCSDTGSNLKNSSTSIKKSKNKFILSKAQCSTPLHKSMSLTYRNKVNNISSKKKKKKPKLKQNLALAFNAPYSSELYKNSDCSHKNGSNFSSEINDKYSFDQSVLISGSHCPRQSNKELSTKNSFKQIGIIHETGTYITSVLNKPSNSYLDKKKKISSSLKKENSIWYNKVRNIIQNEESSFFKESYNEENTILKKKSDNCGADSIIITEHYENKNVISKSFEQKKQLSSSINLNTTPFQCLQNINKSSFSKEDCNTIIDLTKSNKMITIDNIKNRANENSQSSVLCVNDTSKPFDDSLYVSSCQLFENKGIENLVSSNFDCITNIDETLNDKRSIDRTKSIDYTLPQLSQFESSCYNSNDMKEKNINNTKLLSLNTLYDSDHSNSKKTCVDHHNIELLPLITENIKPNRPANYKQTSPISIGNSTESKNNHCVYSTTDPESLILVDVTNKFSGISINDTEKYNQFIIEESVPEEYDQLQNLSMDKLSLKRDSISSNSCSILQSSSCSEQDTVIYKQNCIDINFKENTDPNNLDILETSCKCSYKKCSLCGTDEYNNREISSNQTLTKLYGYNQHFFNNMREPHSLQFNYELKNKLCNSIDSSTINQEKFQLNSDESSSLFNQYENTFTDFENISCIKYEEKSFQTNVSSNSFNDKFEVSESNRSKNISRQKRYAVRFQNSFDLGTINECLNENKVEVENSSQIYNHRYNMDCAQSILSPENLTGFCLKPGKKWRRSMIIVRSFIDGNLDQTNNFSRNNTKGRKWINTVDDVLQQQSIDTSIHQRLDVSNVFKNSICRPSQRYLQRNSSGLENDIARKYILDRCNQEQPISFESWLKPKIKRKWKKIGEGVYGEVFSHMFTKSSTVVKIIPIEGDIYINSERQKMMFEVYSEILIITELNKLFDKNSWNQTNVFCKLKNISCVQGKYPELFIRLWDLFNNEKGSDNDNPKILPDNQMFMILEMENGGVDVESFVFNSAYQTLFAFLQIVFGLAVAEQQFNFEHRDLHIGNLLVRKISANKKISFKLDGELFSVPSQGVKITIIDFTLSRLTHFNKPIYNDLAEDVELFTSYGDYQFEIYRLMKEETNDHWGSYTPKTNIYWLNYVLDKLINSVHYKKTTTAVHSNGIDNLRKLKSSILSFSSAKSFAESDLVLNLL